MIDAVSGANPLPLKKRAVPWLEYVLAALIFFVVSLLLVHLKIVHIDQQFGDTAQLSEVVENIASRGWPASQIMPNVLAATNSDMFSKRADQLANDPLLPPTRHEQNLLHFHAYEIVYPIAVLVRIFPTTVVLQSLYVLSFTAAILLIYFALRRARIPVAAAMAFCFLVTLHPAWSEGLRGQFYPDRMFIFAGLLFMLLASARARNRIALLAAAVFCASLDERGSILAGLFLFAYTALYWTRPNADRWFRFALTFGLLAYGLFAVKFFLPDNIYDSGFLPSNVGILVSRFEGSTFRNSAILFVFVNCSLWLLSWFEWRAALIAFALMIPNIIGNIGGAEKLAFSTHYHDTYLPALIWAAALGFVRLYAGARSIPQRAGALAFFAALLVFAGTIDPTTGTFAESNINNAFVFWFPREAQALAGAAGEQYRQWSIDLDRAIPKNTVVTTVEAGMESLYSGRTLRFFPIDIDHADYAVLFHSGADYGGVVNFLGPAETAKVNAMIVARMQRDGYDFAHPVYVAGNGLVAVRRVR